jgi:ribosomal protein L11 methyltransferase
MHETWLEITIDIVIEQIDTLCFWLSLLEAQATSFEAASDDACQVKAYFPPTMNAVTISAFLEKQLTSPFSYTSRIVEPKDWQTKWHESFQPLLLDRGYSIYPAWQRPDAIDNKMVLLNPQLAFGTGTHPTTRMCLDWLVNHEVSSSTIIDFGCGSGILSMMAAKLSKQIIYAIDIDQQALLASEENAKLNHCFERIKVTDNINKLANTDILIANILLSPLLELAPQFKTLLPKGGELILTGILNEQAQDIIDHYQAWIGLKIIKQSNGWTLLYGKR